jgi:serine/threonine protein kinase
MMMDSTSAERLNSADTSRAGDRKADGAARILRQRWHAGEAPDLVQALNDHPELHDHRSILMDLAYEAFRLGQKAGDSITAQEYSRQFPAMERTLGLYIAMMSLAGSEGFLTSAPSEEQWPHIGEAFLGFDILSELGRGAFGRVYQASERLLGHRQVALKVAWQGVHEAAILGRLRHANIVPILSVHESQHTGLTGFCMPLLGQATLSAVIDRLFREGRIPRNASEILLAVQSLNRGMDLPEPQEPIHRIIRNGTYVEGCVLMIGQLAEALVHAHTRGIYHRDLKPSNILISQEARPLLLDFNLSFDDSIPVIMRAGGTLPYMAPEVVAQLHDDERETAVRHYDPRSDLFSLGVIFYEFLTGRLPFGAPPDTSSLKDAISIMRERHHVKPPNIETLNPDVDRRLAAILKRLLAFDPEQRMPDAQVLAASLRKELTFLPRTFRRLRRRRRAVCALLALLVFLAVAVASWLSLRPSYAERLRRSGIEAYAAKEYRHAIDDLTQSLQAEPSSADARLFRGLAFKNVGDFTAAIADFDDQSITHFIPRIVAVRAYCFSQAGQHSLAAIDYQEYLKHDEASPAIWNNYGFTCLKLGEYEEAERALLRAVHIDASLQAPHFNLVCLQVFRGPNMSQVPSEAFGHAELAVKIGPESGELDRFIAELYAITSAYDPGRVKPAIRYVERAIERGVSPNYFATGKAFRSFQADPSFQAALGCKPSAASSLTTAARLIDPEP